MSRRVLAYGVAVALGERDLTDAGPDSASGSGLRAAFPWTGVVAPWLVSRVLSMVVLLVGAHDPARGSRFTQVATRWDGAFYFDIARHGYGSVDVPFPKWPFFPGLAGLIRALSEVADAHVAIFVVNQLVFLVALAGVYRLARRHGTGSAAALAVWALALFPASFVFSMTYPSGLFLAASVWGFVLVEDHLDPGAAVLALGAAMLRPNGLVVAVSLVVAVRSWRRAIVVAGPAVVGVVAWCWYCADRTGDPLVFLTSKSRWVEITFVGLFSGHVKWSMVPHVVLAIGAIVVVVLQRRRLPVAWLAFAALYLLPSFQLGMVGLGRYANECFVPFVGTGQILERWSPRARYAVLGLSTVGLVAFTFVSARYELVP
ncbi:MAG TPA: hypothetical protein VGA62_08460 [Acidimicrobiia bacterium]